MERQATLGSPSLSDTLTTTRNSNSSAFENGNTTSTWSDSNRRLPNIIECADNDFEQTRYDDAQVQRSGIPNRFAHELEESMQHFLASEIEASEDTAHPWHDLITSSVRAMQSEYDEPTQEFSHNVYQSLSLPLPSVHAYEGHQIQSMADDNTSPKSFYSTHLWGRSDAVLGVSSPESSSSDAQYHQSRHQRAESATSITEKFSSCPHGSGGNINSPSMVSTASPSSSEESSSLSLGPLPEEGQMMLDAVNGFLLVLDSDGRVLFVSENISEHLGFRQVKVKDK
ncbi:nuclear receptor coactivator 1 [Plakobranchus ocellatus]|uniref:Nuclear receptor coactivator 1 n=1 Tax=Plakobranchus ocellatus TaxID=259542 RepID=A0AAV4B953_9GAST|nr:nuclear receptor coactivator 1 [Plakobranchus ocellatus]